MKTVKKLPTFLAVIVVLALVVYAAPNFVREAPVFQGRIEQPADHDCEIYLGAMGHSDGIFQVVRNAVDIDGGWPEDVTDDYAEVRIGATGHVDGVKYRVELHSFGDGPLPEDIATVMRYGVIEQYESQSQGKPTAEFVERPVIKAEMFDGYAASDWVTLGDLDASGEYVLKLVAWADDYADSSEFYTVVVVTAGDGSMQCTDAVDGGIPTIPTPPNTVGGN